MDVFTYTGDTVISGDQTNWLPKKNCRIKINFPAGMSEATADSLISSIKGKTVSDILLYGAVSFISSDEDSTLFPSSDYALLVVPSNIAIHFSNINNSAFVVFADDKKTIYMLDADSMLYCGQTNHYISKVGDIITIKSDGIACLAPPPADSSDWVFAL